MRLSTFLPYALLVATASFATAHPMDSNTFAYVLSSEDDHLVSRVARSPRTNNGLSLSARELEAITLLARDFIAEALVARTDRPRREQFKEFDDYEKAWIAWNRRNRKVDHGMQKINKTHQPGDRPLREQFKSFEEYEKAFLKWNRTSRKGDHASQKLIKSEAAKGEKEQEKIRAKADKKGKRELAYEWDELE